MKNFMVCMLSFLGSAELLGIPFASNNCSSHARNIRHPEHAQGILFDESCQTAYVLPPQLGKVRIKAIAPTSNLGLCPTVLGIPPLAKRYIQVVDHLMSRIEGMMLEFAPESQELEELRQKDSEAKIQKEQAHAQLVIVEREERKLLEESQSAAKEWKTCQAFSDIPCEQEQKDLKHSREVYKEFYTARYLPILETYESARISYDHAHEDYLFHSAEFTRTLTPLLDLQTHAHELYKSIFDLYKDYAPLEGFTAQALYSVDWDRLLNEYAELNPGLAMSFLKIPIISSQIHASAKVDGKDAKFPVLLHASLPGLAPMGFQDLENSEKKITADKQLPNFLNTGLGLGDANISGQLTLSLVGACPFFPEGKFKKSKLALDHDQIAAHLVVNASYEYPMKVHRRYTAEYNLSQFMKRVETKTRKTGWFSASHTHELLEDANSEDWFRISFDSQDPEFQYTAKEQNSITQEVKLNLMERALRSVGSVSFTETSPPLPELPKTGGALWNAPAMCQLWSYCYGASYFIGVLGTFGKSKAVSKFMHENKVWVRDDVQHSTVMRRTITLSFNPQS